MTTPDPARFLGEPDAAEWAFCVQVASFAPNPGTVPVNASTILAVQRALAAQQQDAARYRWLRATTNHVTSKGERIDVRDKPEVWDAAIDSAIAAAKLSAPQQAAPAPAAEAVPTFAPGDLVRKRSGSAWEGHVVGTYSTTLTPEGYAVESSAHPGSVQIYPVAALERVG